MDNRGLVVFFYSGDFTPRSQQSLQRFLAVFGTEGHLLSFCSETAPTASRRDWLLAPIPEKENTIFRYGREILIPSALEPLDQGNRRDFLLVANRHLISIQHWRHMKRLGEEHFWVYRGPTLLERLQSRLDFPRNGQEPVRCQIKTVRVIRTNSLFKISHQSGNLVKRISIRRGYFLIELNSPQQVKFFTDRSMPRIPLLRRKLASFKSLFLGKRGSQNQL